MNQNYVTTQYRLCVKIEKIKKLNIRFSDIAEFVPPCIKMTFLFKIVL